VSWEVIVVDPATAAVGVGALVASGLGAAYAVWRGPRTKPADEERILPTDLQPRQQQAVDHAPVTPLTPSGGPTSATMTEPAGARPHRDATVIRFPARTSTRGRALPATAARTNRRLAARVVYALAAPPDPAVGSSSPVHRSAGTTVGPLGWEWSR
jgi:hypothetical protein